jgi:hypothetical protein
LVQQGGARCIDMSHDSKRAREVSAHEIPDEMRGDEIPRIDFFPATHYAHNF